MITGKIGASTQEIRQEIRRDIRGRKGEKGCFLFVLPLFCPPLPLKANQLDGVPRTDSGEQRKILLQHAQRKR